jgi:hypothetical protein
MLRELGDALASKEGASRSERKGCDSRWRGIRLKRRARRLQRDDLRLLQDIPRGPLPRPPVNSWATPGQLFRDLPGYPERIGDISFGRSAHLVRGERHHAPGAVPPRVRGRASSRRGRATPSLGSGVLVREDTPTPGAARRPRTEAKAHRPEAGGHGARGRGTTHGRQATSRVTWKHRTRDTWPQRACALGTSHRKSGHTRQEIGPCRGELAACRARGRGTSCAKRAQSAREDTAPCAQAGGARR